MKGSYIKMFKTSYLSPIGKMYICSDGENISGLWLERQKYFPKNIDDYVENNNLPIFEKVKVWLQCYFDGNVPEDKLPLMPKGTSFQKSVWDILLNIRYGTTISYGEISKILQQSTGKNVSYQAVGGAVGRNPILILIACHRVVGKDGILVGYAGGTHNKQWLLNHELETKEQPS